jgi:hypothetical protein
MSDEPKKIVPINYTRRTFTGIRDELVQLTERYYPNTFQDWSEASFGALMLDAVAYVGDQLNFYLDYNVNECFLDTSYQYSNILRHGRALGYKHTGKPSLHGRVALYVLIPASVTGIGPDRAYCPLLRRGSTFTAQNGIGFVLTENVDFGDLKNPTVVARVDTNTGSPTYYAIKAEGTVVSGNFTTENYTVGPYERFRRIRIDEDVTEIISVIDGEGNEYFEVDYLAQDMVFKEMTNKNFLDDNVPSILKPMLVSRKFVVERDRNNTYLQFGSGKEGDSDVVANPQQVALNMYGKTYTTDVTFDPTRLPQTINYGIVPSSTTLTVVMRVNNTFISNVTVGGLNKVNNARFKFSNPKILTRSKTTNVIKSIEVQNELPIIGKTSSPTSTEVKRRIYDTFPTQNRAVTQADYESLAYRMPAKYGSIKRVSIQKDPTSLKRNLNMYVISEDKYGKLTLSNQAIKDNLKTWLNQYRMMNDTIDILDPYIIDVGVEFAIKASHGVDKFALLAAATMALNKRFNTPFFIGEPLYISDIYNDLKQVRGVLDVVKVKITNKTGTNYSSNVLEISQNLSPDGDYLVVPKNAILQVRFPKMDIIGKIR